MRANVAWVVAIAVVLSSSVFAFAKRSAPEDVPPVTHGGIEYRAPNDVEKQGFVLAFDIASKTQIWARQVYVVVKEPSVESDIQEIFINSMKLDGDTLLLTNERGYEYRLDLNSLNVEVIKGKSVIRPGILNN